MPGLRCLSCTPLCHPTADGVARDVWEEESTKEVLDPHSSEPVDLSLISLWVQVLEALCDPRRRNTGSFSKIHQDNETRWIQESNASIK